MTVYLFSLLLSVSLPSSISHSYSISLTLPSSSQSGALHLHISLALSRFILLSFLSTALAVCLPVPPSLPMSFISSSSSSSFQLRSPPSSSFPYCRVSTLPPSIILLACLPSPRPLLSALSLPPFRALQCGCVGDDVRDAAAGVSSGRVYIRVLQPCGLQPLSG